MNKEHILNEIRRTAAANGGVALGVERFQRETGIRPHDWRGRIWIRWSDALREAGFHPNELTTAIAEDELIEKFIGLAHELGHFPLSAEVDYKARQEGFPWYSTFAQRLGLKPQLAARILEYCRNRAGHEDIIALCEPIAAARDTEERQHLDKANTTTTKQGYVYMALMKVGREKRYKIGNAVLVERRKDQIAIQLPENLELVHSIATDDAYGIEDYWHGRFAAKHTNGEWFSLSPDDVRAFKRRKFM